VTRDRHHRRDDKRYAAYRRGRLGFQIWTGTTAQVSPFCLLSVITAKAAATAPTPNSQSDGCLRGAATPAPRPLALRPPAICSRRATARDVDFTPEYRTGVLAPLNDPAYLAQVTLDPEAGTIAWPDGIDLVPEPLYEQAKAHPPIAAA
jgi:hypothetical protein